MRASPSSSDNESSVPRWKYDVFLSFRGEDTRKGIISHLSYEFQKTGAIKAFVDDQGLEVGAPISPSLLRAIEESRFAIVVLSENYASSSWCLEELQQIIQCMEGEGRVLPLFYNVDPSDVRKQTGRFGLALAEHEENSTHSQEKVKQWRVALEMVSNHSGWDARNFRSDRELVKHIVEVVCSKVQQPSADSAMLETHNSHVNDESRPEVEKTHFKVGPYGSHQGGNPFDDGLVSAVKQLVVCYDKTKILFIKVEYIDLNGISFWSDNHGDERSIFQIKVETVTLNYPDEYLTSIHGKIEDLWYLPSQIISLSFHSNKRIYGPFGDDTTGTGFSIQVPQCKIVGFFGRFSKRNELRALGAYLKPLPSE